jgi:hypothetical protein
VLVWALAACGGGDPDYDGVDPSDVLASSAEAMAAVESASFEMRRSGATVEIEGMVFDSAVGEYVAPDSARALLRLRAGDLSVELGTISIGERTWLTNPLSGSWEELESGTGFNPADIFDPDIGWPPLLTDDISNVEYLDRRGGVHRIRGTVAGERMAVLTAGLADAQPVTVEMEIDRSTNRLHRLEFETMGDGGVSSWVIDLSGYDESVQIQPPSDG